AISQHESALELARGDAAMEVLARFVVLLTPANHQLAFLDADIELIPRESCNCERNTQALRVLPITGQPLDVVGRIAIGHLGNAIEHALDLVEAEEERAGK